MSGFEDLHGEPPADPGLYAGVMMNRVVAFLIDMVIVAVIWGGLAVISVFLGLISFGLLWGPATAFMTLLPIIYHALFIAAPGRATPGMKMMNIEVRSWNGNRPTPLQALIMSLVFYITLTPTAGLVLIVALLNSRNRTLHDFVAGTVMVDSRQAALWQGRDFLPEQSGRQF